MNYHFKDTPLSSMQLLNLKWSIFSITGSNSVRLFRHRSDEKNNAHEKFNSTHIEFNTMWPRDQRIARSGMVQLGPSKSGMALSSVGPTWTVQVQDGPQSGWSNFCTNNLKKNCLMILIKPTHFLIFTFLGWHAFIFTNWPKGS